MTPRPALDAAPTEPQLAGWRQHPEHAMVERYWDGGAWTTEHRFNLDATDADAASPLSDAEPAARYAAGPRIAVAVAACLTLSWSLSGLGAPTLLLLVAGVLVPAEFGRALLLAGSALVGLLLGGFVGSVLECLSCEPDIGLVVASALIGGCLAAGIALAGYELGRWLDRLVDARA